MTDWAELIVTVQVVDVPVQAPLQPAKVEPPFGVAVRATSVPLLNEAVQVGPQSIPAGEEITVPPPVPLLETVRLYWIRVKVAVTDWEEFMVTVQEPVPEQAPPQPVKIELPSGVAVRLTTVPLVNEAVQVAPQLIPAGEEVTVPPPVPVLLTVRVGPAVLFTNIKSCW